jgi:acetyltransferase-like isoleucine patch superfamily enzyme
MRAPAGAFFHPFALVETERIGEGTRVWAFAHILPGAVVGRECNVCDHVFIENDVVIGDRVTLKCGVQIWDGITLEDDVFVGPNATFTNDPFPRSKKRPPAFSRTVVHKGASIGANATILPGLTIGRDAMIGAGAIVTADVPPNAVVVGTPASIAGYAETSKVKPHQPAAPLLQDASQPTGIPGARVLHLPRNQDLRGSLVVGEIAALLPFEVKRFFVVFDVPSREVRGEHAHRRLSQFLVCVRGQCRVLLDDGQARAEVSLDDPAVGVIIPPLVWSVQYRFSADAMLLVLASEPYDPGEYVRDYDEFRTIIETERRC